MLPVLLLISMVNALKGTFTVESISFWPEESRLAFFESLEYSNEATLSELPHILGPIKGIRSLQRDYQKVELDEFQCTHLVEYFLYKPHYHPIVLPFSMVSVNINLVRLLRPVIALYRPGELTLSRSTQYVLFSHDEMVYFLSHLGSNPEYCQDEQINNLFTSFNEFTYRWEIGDPTPNDYINLLPQTGVFRAIMEYSPDKELAPLYGEDRYADYDFVDRQLQLISQGDLALFKKWDYLRHYLEAVTNAWKLSGYRKVWWQCKLALTIIQLCDHNIRTTANLLSKRHFRKEAARIFAEIIAALGDYFPRYLIKEMIELMNSWGMSCDIAIRPQIAAKLIEILKDVNLPLKAYEDLNLSLESWRISLRHLQDQSDGVNLLDFTHVVPIDEFLYRWSSYRMLSPVLFQCTNLKRPLMLQVAEEEIYKFQRMDELLEFLTQHYLKVIRVNSIISKREALSPEEVWLLRGFGRLLASNLFHRGHFGVSLHELQEENTAFLPFADYDHIQIDPMRWPFDEGLDHPPSYGILHRILYRDANIDSYMTLDTLRRANQCAIFEMWEKYGQVVMNPLTFIAILFIVIFNINI